MNEQRTHLRGGFRIGGPRARIAGGILRWLCSLLMTGVPRLVPCAASLISFVTLLSPTGVCAAAESNAPADKAVSQAKGPDGAGQAASASAGIRDPLNAHAYMQELAAKLHPSIDKSLLLKGVPQSQGSSQQTPGTSKGPGGNGISPSSAVITAGVIQPELEGKKGKAAAKENSAPGPFMDFWDHPSLKSDPGQDPVAASEASAGREKPASAGPVVNQQAEAVPVDPREDILGPMGVALASMKPGVMLAPKPSAMVSPANFAAQVPAEDGSQVKATTAQADLKDVKWSVGADLDKYRAHAVKDGSRESGRNIQKAFERAGLTLEDGVNVFVLGYASERGKVFRSNDGKGLLDEPGKVPQRAGAVIGSAGLGLYSVADLILLNGLPDPNGAAYRENHPVVRPLLFTGRMVGGVWKTTEEVGNAVTWGYFDNITGCIGMCIEDILELLKHAGEAVTNIARAPVRLVAGKNEGAERAMDWVLLVPLEFVSNATEMKGIANMEDYKAAFEDKGVIGSVVELGGSSFLVYRGAKELADKFDDKHHRRCRTTADAGEGATPDVPPEPPAPPPPPPPDVVFLLDGIWPVEGGSSGAILIDGVWTTIKTWRE
jgi:hypothetical protein